MTNQPQDNGNFETNPTNSSNTPSETNNPNTPVNPPTTGVNKVSGGTPIIPTSIPNKTPGNTPTSTEEIDEDQVSASEIENLFSIPSTSIILSPEEQIERAFCNADYKGPKSYAEGRELVLKNKGKEWNDIPPNERICFVLLNLVVSGRVSATGSTGIAYDPGRRSGTDRRSIPGGNNLSLTRTTKEWGGMFTRVVDPETNEMKMIRLDDSKNVPLTCTFFMPPETFQLIGQMMEQKGTQVVDIGILASAEVNIAPLNQQSRREQYAQMKREAQARGEEFDENTDENAFLSLGATLNTIFIDKHTIVTAAQVNLSTVETDPTKLVLKMTKTTMAGFENNREIRRQQIINEDVRPAESTAPKAIDQMNAVQPDTEKVEL